MSRTLGGTALLLLAAFMLFGFTRSALSISGPATVIALLLTVVAPAMGGIALLRRRRQDARTLALRQETLEAEVLGLAMRHQGRLTAVEVATEFGLSPEEAKAVLDGLVTREVADLEMTDRGVLVYSFHEARHVGGKHDARGLLDA